MAAIVTGDSGVAVLPTARAPVFDLGMPAATTGTADTGIATSTAARPTTRNPLSGVNPPQATVDLGSN